MTGLVLALSFLTNIAAAQTNAVILNPEQEKDGLKIGNQSDKGIDLHFSLNQYFTKQELYNGKYMEKITMDGVILPNTEGAPDLPVLSRYIAIPAGATAKLKVNIRNRSIKQQKEIMPAPRIPKENEDGPLFYEKDNSIYGKDTFYPENNVIISSPMKIRGVDVVMVSVSPFRYNPVTKVLEISNDIDISIDFEGGNGTFGEKRYLSRFWEPILKDNILNSSVLPKPDYSATVSREQSGYEYIIISPDDPGFLAWADSIKMFRIREGIKTGVVTTSQIGGNTTVAIEHYIDSMYLYADIPPAAVLLLGDYGFTGNTINCPVYNDYCVSDNLYADVNHDDLPDVVLARITARDVSELEHMVTKFIDYEQNPPTNPDFYDHPVTAMGWQTERWFQLCSEVIAGFFENSLGKHPVRENAIYQGNPANGIWSTASNTNVILNEFGPSGLGYIPASPTYLTDWDANAARVNHDINNGAFLLQHRDHGYTGGWGEPAYNKSSIDGLYNTDLTWIFSINCLTGKFNDPSECFAEKFHRYTYGGQNSGALGITAASEVSYSFVNDTYVWGMYDNMWPGFLPDYGSNPESRGILPAFANAAGKYFLAQSSWPSNPGNKEVTYYLFHHHGGAFSKLYSEVPQQLTVVHDPVILAGLDHFTVQADENSFIALTVGDEIIGTAEGTGEPVDIAIAPQLPGTWVNIVVTKQNYYRYENRLQVIPPIGPYCLYQDHSVNDSTGNGNGLPDFDEPWYLNLSMHNLGSEDGHQVMVTLKTDDPFVTVSDSLQNYETIAAGAVKIINNAFLVHASDSIPNQHEVFFTVEAKDDNDSVWISHFSIVANAPEPVAGSLAVDDTLTGTGDGILDPGEYADILIRVENHGNCSANDFAVTFLSLNPFIEVLNPYDTISQIAAGGFAIARFPVHVLNNAPVGFVAETEVVIQVAGYHTYKYFYPKIRAMIEDFETGDFTKYDWKLSGGQHWFVTDVNPYEGSFSAKSGAIGDGQSSIFYITYEVMENDSIKFMKKVSSEADFDKLIFYIDNTMVGEWSGTTDNWSKEIYPVTAGQHTFLWMYRKDYSTSSGDDCAWLDNIELPTKLMTTLSAGPNREICFSDSFQTDAIATYFDSLYWSTSGDGTFDDIHVVTPLYVPGVSDIETGSVWLKLNVFGSDGLFYQDSMNLAIHSIPEMPLLPIGPDTVDVFSVSETVFVIKPVPNATEYLWAVYPDDAGTIAGTDTTALVIWNPDYLDNAWIKVKALNQCGESDFSDSLTVFIDNTSGIKGLSAKGRIVVMPNPNNGLFTVQAKNLKPGLYSMKLISMTGETVFSAVNPDSSVPYRFGAKSLQPGIYLLVITLDNKQYLTKVVVK